MDGQVVVNKTEVKEMMNLIKCLGFVFVLMMITSVASANDRQERRAHERDIAGAVLHFFDAFTGRPHYVVPVPMISPYYYFDPYAYNPRFDHHYIPPHPHNPPTHHPPRHRRRH